MVVKKYASDLYLKIYNRMKPTAKKFVVLGIIYVTDIFYQMVH